MTVLYHLLDYIRVLADETNEELRLIEAGKLSLIRNGKDYSQHRAEELRARLVKLQGVIESFNSNS